MTDPKIIQSRDIMGILLKSKQDYEAMSPEERVAFDQKNARQSILYAKGGIAAVVDGLKNER